MKRAAEIAAEALTLVGLLTAVFALMVLVGAVTDTLP